MGLRFVTFALDNGSTAHVNPLQVRTIVAGWQGNAILLLDGGIKLELKCGMTDARAELEAAVNG